MIDIGSEPIGGYRLLEFLGEGSFGSVYKATAPGGLRVACKFVPLYSRKGTKELRSLMASQHNKSATIANDA